MLVGANNIVCEWMVGTGNRATIENSKSPGWLVEEDEFYVATTTCPPAKFKELVFRFVFIPLGCNMVQCWL